MLIIEKGFAGKSMFFPQYEFSIYENGGVLFIEREQEVRIITLEDAFKLVELWKGYVFGIWGYEFSERRMEIEKKKRCSILSFPSFILLFLSERSQSLPRGSSFEVIYADSVKCLVSDSEFLNGVKTAIRKMEEGEMYVINLARPFVIHNPQTNSWMDLFFTLREVHPAEYSFYLQFKDWHVLSNSPELFLRKEGNVLITEPIKGTISTDVPDGNVLLRRNEKEKAENIMIVDLMRNDLGMVCIPGSVYVESFFEVKRLKTVYQMFSKIKGTVKENEGLYSLLTKLTPPGSVTGTPKFQVMKNISELERFKRNIYCGTAFLISEKKDFVMNVLIRTLIIEHDRGVYFAGAGITVDSNPLQETAETLLKFKNILSLLRLKSSSELIL